MVMALRANRYLNSDTEITALLTATLSLLSVNALRCWTFHALSGWTAVARLSHSDALDLCRNGVDLDRGGLTIRVSKLGKSQLIPLHTTTVAMQPDYAARHDVHPGAPRSPCFFVAEQGGRLLHQYVQRVFWQLSRQVGLRQQGQRNGPRIHDLRHRFAAKTHWNCAVPASTWQPCADHGPKDALGRSRSKAQNRKAHHLLNGRDRSSAAQPACAKPTDWTIPIPIPKS